MPQFKVGDWVYMSKADPHPICISTKDKLECVNKHTKFWKPNEGELYWDKCNGHLCKYTSITIHNSGRVTVFGSVVDLCLKHQAYSTQVSCILSKCEPFIGPLPSFLKEQ